MISPLFVQGVINHGSRFASPIAFAGCCASPYQEKHAKSNEWCINFTSRSDRGRWLQTRTAAIPLVACGRKRWMVLASELFNVSDEVALVTGGGTGMGFAMARALAVNGARLALAGNDPESLEAGVNCHSGAWRTGRGGADGCAR
jgi:hypothetical protein